MPPKPQTSDSASSTSASESASSDEEQETAVAQAIPPSKKPVPNAKPPVSDDEDSGSDEDEEDEEDEEDKEGSDDSDSPDKPGKTVAKVEAASAVKTPVEESESESESSESSPKLPSPRRLSRGDDSSAKPISSKPKDLKMAGKKPSPEKPKMPVASAVGTEKRKRQEAENGDQGEAAANGSHAKKGKRGGKASRSTGGSAVSKRLVMGGEDVEGEAEVLYPRLQDAIHLLEMEDGNILLKGSMTKALELLNPAEANALEDRWKKHLAAGVKYFLERAALKEDLLKSLVGVLESK